MKAFKVKDLYLHARQASADLLPAQVGLDFWDEVYTGTDKPVIDREFARRFSGFTYYDFLMAEDAADSLSDLKSDIISILTFNKKRYEEMYRVFLVSDQEDPITYNYDMTETTGAQHNETTYGRSVFTKGEQTFTKGEQENTKGSMTFTKGEQENTKGSMTFTKGEQENTKGSMTFTKGEQENTKGEQEDTNGAVTDTHSVSPYNSSTISQPEYSDGKSSQTITEGQRIDTEGERQDTEGQRIDTEGEREDTEGQRIDTEGEREDTEGQRIDTEGEREDVESQRVDINDSHTDEYDSDAWTLTRKGNIGVQTAGDILRIHTQYWTEHYKFLQLIFDDICKQLLFAEV